MSEQNKLSNAGSADNSKRNQFICLQIPLLGTKSFQEVIAFIQKAMIDEATTINLYQRLLKDAPDEFHREFINHACCDEVEHLHFFESLYYQYMNKKPSYNFRSIPYCNYKEGILIALNGEFEAIDFYRNVQLSVTDQLIRDTFYFAMVDEQEHATRFSVLYNQL